MLTKFTSSVSSGWYSAYSSTAKQKSKKSCFVRPVPLDRATLAYNKI